MRHTAGIAVVLALGATAFIGGAVEWWLWARQASRADVNPVLSEGELMRLTTYKRVCRSSVECEWPLSCALDVKVDKLRCVASECETDLQCEEGFTCRAIHATKPRVRACMVIGTRQEGERCEGFPRRAHQGCAAGLVCAFGHCGRPCRLDKPSLCPAGTQCRDTDDGPACAPACRPGDCAEGRECIAFRDGIAACGVVVGQNCDRVPCPAGQECRRRMIGLRDRIAMGCETPCKSDSDCPSELHCFSKFCRRPCNVKDPSTCGPQEECMRYPAGPFEACQLADK